MTKIAIALGVVAYCVIVAIDVTCALFGHQLLSNLTGTPYEGLPIFLRVLISLFAGTWAIAVLEGDA